MQRSGEKLQARERLTPSTHGNDLRRTMPQAGSQWCGNGQRQPGSTATPAWAALASTAAWDLSRGRQWAPPGHPLCTRLGARHLQSLICLEPVRPTHSSHRPPLERNYISPSTHCQSENSVGLVSSLGRTLKNADIWFFPHKGTDRFFKLAYLNIINQVVHLPSTDGTYFDNPSYAVRIGNLGKVQHWKSICEFPAKKFSTHSFVLIFLVIARKGSYHFHKSRRSQGNRGRKTTSL